MNHVSLLQLQEIRKANTGKRLAFISGQFNVVHPGHIRLLKFARSLADHLVVALLPDSSGAYVPQDLRLAAMRSLEMVGQAFIVLDNIEACVKALKPDIIVKGAEHENGDNPEDEWLKGWNGSLIFCTDDPKFSLDDVIQGLMRGRGGSDKISLPTEYLRRHDIAPASLTSILDKVGDLKVGVVGDLIIDEYVICTPLGMSREDPTLVVSPIEETRFVGGAGIVAGHANGLGGSAHFVTVAGDDDGCDYAGAFLEKQGVNTHILRDPDRPTTVKRRYRAQNKTLLRVNRLSQQQISREMQRKTLNLLFGILPEMDLLIFSDFSYGVLPGAMVEKIIEECRRLDVPMTADSQTSSQIGDLAKFKSAQLVTPTEVEARHAVGNYHQGLVAVAGDLIQHMDARNVIVTLGEDGCLIHCPPTANSIYTDNLPALNPRPLDVAGAGDSLLTMTSLAMAAGSDIWRAALLGSVAAGIQVGRMGNVPLTRDNIRQGLGL